ncbi:tyrosine-type recombinase/integrase [Nocardioides bruguierae]|uniref:Site-specific integrase n=1 Tax=Nocardioides bruguierae TaxID=2945102 RepID=A0A9X2IHQ7_9ACTN|nr:tyrosine-type recombinase/integrase [Nocardioides bruguierae]MCM0622839.1 site-specific integrase [Nocardioides bruguierae]
MPKTPDRRRFGQITKLPSGRYRARYSDPDGRQTTPADPERRPEPIRYAAPTTFDTREDAEAWLVAERRLIGAGEWTPPAARAEARRRAEADARRAGVTFGEWADSWLAGRRVKGRPLAERTRAHYRTLLDEHILPTFADVPLRDITVEDVERWHTLTAAGRPTLQAHAYSLLRTILGTAVQRGLIRTGNPATIRGAGTSTRARKVRPASLAELRRKDIDIKHGVIRIRRGVVRAAGTTIVKAPKSDAGTRDVAIPPHLLPLVREHLLQHTAPGQDGLLFPANNGRQLSPSSLYGRAPTKTSAGWGFYGARAAAGRDDLRWHDLRHTGAVLAAQTGATLAELMGRLGHSTPGAAMRYQHAAAERDAEIARRLSALVDGQ